MCRVKRFACVLRLIARLICSVPMRDVMFEFVYFLLLRVTFEAISGHHLKQTNITFIIAPICKQFIIHDYSN